MRAIQGAIVGVGLPLVAMVAMALLIGEPGSMAPDPSRPSTQATGPRGPLAGVPTSPPEPVAASEDTSVGTLPPPSDSSLSTQLVSHDLLAPSNSAPDARIPADGKPRDTRDARPAPKPAETSGQVPTMPEDFTATQDGWDWSEWVESEDARHDDCRPRDRYDQYDRHTGCDRRD